PPRPGLLGAPREGVCPDRGQGQVGGVSGPPGSPGGRRGRAAPSRAVRDPAEEGRLHPVLRLRPGLPRGPGPKRPQGRGAGARRAMTPSGSTPSPPPPDGAPALTAEQGRALDVRGASVALSAGAGCGK